jgi:hypothetical protein
VSIFRRHKPNESSLPPRASAEGERARPKRILVIGSEGHGKGVTSYSWDKFPDNFNVADFDVVILNFAAFDEDQALAEGFPPERLPDRNSLGRLFFAEGSELIAIGDPSTEIGPEPEGRGYILGRRSASDWLPFWFAVERTSGTAFELKDDEWAFYFSRLSRYEWFMSGESGLRHQDPTHYFRAIGIHGADGMIPNFKAIAETRFEKPIAISFRLFAARHKQQPGLALTYSEPELEPMRLSSPIHWLPSLPGTTAAEAVDLILAERYGISTEQRRPDWVEDYSLPAEEQVAAEISGLEEDREALARKLADARLRAEQAAAPSALLYEKGKNELEPPVREALRALGADVRPPNQEGIEDGLLARTEGEGVLEIKGRKGPIKQDDVRQVVQWAADAKGRDGVDYKPLIVGNAHCEIPPPERGDPLAPNALDYARNSGVAVLTTVQVYNALRERQEGTFDEAAFWTAVFSAQGPVEWPGPG